jgi:hypothetical protein
MHKVVRRTLLARWLLALMAVGLWALWRRGGLEIQGDLLPPSRS